jgi:hypothetical protein
MKLAPLLIVLWITQISIMLFYGNITSDPATITAPFGGGNSSLSGTEYFLNMFVDPNNYSTMDFV